VIYLIFIRSRGVADWRQCCRCNVRLGHGRRDRGNVDRNQRWFEVAYFWGIGGTLQAVLTAEPALGFPDWRFISFFTSHCGIIVGVIFLMLTRRYRPYPVSIVRVWLWSEFYFVVRSSLMTHWR